MYYLVDTILQRADEYRPTIDFIEPTMKDALPLVAER